MYRCKLCGDTFETKTPKKTQAQLRDMMNEKGHLCYNMLFKEKDNINQNRGLKQIEERKKLMGWFCVDCDAEQIAGFNQCHECGSEVFEERVKNEKTK